MKKDTAVFAFLILLIIQVLYCENTYAASESSGPEAAGEVSQGVVDDYYGELTGGLLNWMKTNGAVLNKQPGCTVPEPGPIAEPPPSPPKGLSKDMESLFRDYYAGGNMLAEIDKIYGADLPTDIKFMELQEKGTLLIEKGYVGKKKEGWLAGTMGRLKQVVEKASSLQSGEQEKSAVKREDLPSSGLTVYRIVDKDYDSEGQSGRLTVTLRLGGGKALSEEVPEKMIEMQLPGSGEWIPLVEGEDIPEGTRIYTGNGHTILQDRDGNFYKIPPMTKVDVGEDQHLRYKADEEEIESD